MPIARAIARTAIARAISRESLTSPPIGGGAFDPMEVFEGGGVTGLIYEIDPALTFSDAGMTTPAVLTGSVAKIQDRSGNGLHATCTNCTLQQDSNGKYYLATINSSTIDSPAFTLLSSMDLQMAVYRPVGAPDFIAAYNASTGDKYVGYPSYGGASVSHSGSGSPTLAVNGVDVPGAGAATRAQLRTKLSTGEPQVFEVRGANLSPWTAMKFAGYFSSLALAGRFYGAVLTPPQDAATRTQIRGYMAGRSGSAIPLPTSGIALGDSTIAAYNGTNAVLDYVTTSANKHTMAVPGDTIDRQKVDYQAARWGLTARWIVVQVGLNDLAPAEAASAAIARLQGLVDALNANTPASCKVLVSQMTPCRARLIAVHGATDGPIAYQKWLDMNTAIAGGGATPITDVDGRITAHVALLNDGSGNLAAAYDTGDGIHENNAGRDIIGKAWMDALAAAGVEA